MKKGKLMIPKSKVVSALLYGITPFVFCLNIYLFVFVILFHLFFFAKQCKSNEEKFVILFLNAILYSAVSILGLRLYDWVIIFYFIKMIIRRKEKIISTMQLLIFCFFIVLVFLMHTIGTKEIIETVRYIVSLILVLLILNADLEKIKNKLSEQLMSISWANLYNAIVVFLLMSSGKIHNLTGTIISTNIYIYSEEIRLNGFFSDPNKYMVFCLALLFVFELFVKNKKKIVYLILCCAIVFSVARTALVCIAVYFILKAMIKIKEKSKKAFYILLVLELLAIVIVTLFPQSLYQLINEIFQWSAVILGRERTVRINATLADDNRIAVWKVAGRYILKAPFLGYGWEAYNQLLPYPTHNTVLSLLLDGGILLLLVYLYTFWPLFSYKRFDITIPCIVIPALVLDLGNYRVWFFLLALIIKENNSYRKNIKKL